MAETQLLLEAKKLHLQQFAANKYLLHPTELWNAIVEHRFKPKTSPHSPCNGAAEVAGLDEAMMDAQGPEQGELRLSYEGYKALAEQLVMSKVRSAYDSVGRTLSSEEEQEVYFSHPLLSPKTFMAFPRDGDECILAIPLFTYVAKKLLLYNLRAKLELCASVPPPALREKTHQSPTGPAAVPLSRSSPLSNALTSDDIEGFIAMLVPNLRLVRDMPPWMLPYYLCHAAQKFCFMLDNLGVGCISIETFIRSEVFSELLRIYESDDHDAIVQFRIGATVEVAEAKVKKHIETTTGFDDDNYLQAVVAQMEWDGGNPADANYTVTVTEQTPDGEGSETTQLSATLPRECLHWCPATTESIPSDFAALDNWFSLPIMHRVYKTYCDLDIDSDGLLSVAEMLKYNSGSFTPLVIERAFELYVPKGVEGKMDFKTFLHFVLATEHPNAEPSLKYMWKLLDLHGTRTYIEIDVLRVFCKAVSSALLENGLMEIAGDSILAEAVDMIDPSWHEHLTYNDVKKSGHGGTVLPILLDYRNFYAYDCREQNAATDAAADPGSQ